MLEFFVTKAFMLLPKHGRFMRFAVDLNCVTEAMSQVILLCTQWALSKELNINEEEPVGISARVYVDAVEAIEVQTRLDVREVSEGSIACRSFRHTSCTS